MNGPSYGMLTGVARQHVFSLWQPILLLMRQQELYCKPLSTSCTGHAQVVCCKDMVTDKDVLPIEATEASADCEYQLVS